MKIFLPHIQNTCVKQKGFTLLEALIGISIVVVAITATFGATQNGLRSAIESRDQITAFYLAQEGIEQIRNMRDTNSINGSPWLRGFAESGDACFFGQSCIVDAVLPVANPPVSCSGGGTTPCPNIRQDLSAGPTYGFYGNTGSWTSTNFNREIRIENNVPNREILVTVIMKWGTDKSFVAKEILLNWQ